MVEKKNKVQKGCFWVKFFYRGNFLSTLLFFFMGCGAAQNIPDFGRGLSNASTSSTSGYTTGWQWSGPTAIDVSGGGQANFVANDGSVTAPHCRDSVAGFSSSGCVQQPSMVFSGSRFFIGYPQKLTGAGLAAGYDYFNILTALSNVSTSLFGNLGSGLGYLNTIGTPYQVARYVSFAKLSSGKVIAVYWIYNSVAAGTHVYTNIYDPNSQTWSGMTQMSTAIYNEVIGLNVSWEDYSAANPTEGFSGNNCRPKIAASGNTAMVVWCEQDLLFADTHTYLRYARYDGSQWLADNRISSALLAQSGSNGMNEDSAGLTLDLRTSYHPGMARRMAVQAQVPNALFAADFNANEIRIFFPVPTVDTALPGGNFDYSNPGAGSTLITGLNFPASVTTDGTRLIVANSGSSEIRIWDTIPIAASAVGTGTAIDTGTIGGTNDVEVPFSLFVDQYRLYVVNGLGVTTGGVRSVLVWNSIPTTDVEPSFILNTGLTTPQQVFSTGTKLFVSDSGTQSLHIWNTIPSMNQAADALITGFTTANRGIFSDGRRLIAAESSTIYIWHTIPTANTTIASADLSISFAAGNIRSITSDGVRMFVANDSGTVYVWNQIPLENKTFDVQLTGFTAVTSVIWSRFVAPTTTSWPNPLAAPYTSYSVNPKSTDTMTVVFRGQSILLNNLLGDPQTLDRCVAISEIVNQINQNTTLQSLKIRAQLPAEWEGPECDDTMRGLGQFFYLTQNPDFDPSEGVDVYSNFGAGEQTDAGGGGGVLPEDLSVTFAGDNTYRFFYQNGTAASDSLISYNPVFATGNHAQYIVGKFTDDASTVSSSNGVPLVSANGLASDPQSTFNDHRMMDLSSTEFVEVAGTGNGRFQVVSSHRAVAQPYYKLTCTNLSTTYGCSTWASTPTNRRLIPSELAYPRILFGFVHDGTDWLRRHLKPAAMALNPSIPKNFFIGPTNPFAIDYATQTVQPFPLGARWPKTLSSGNGKALVLFYARNGQRPYGNISSATYGSSANYDQPSDIQVSNALWMSVYDDATGFSPASAISPDTSSDRYSSGSLATDLDVCETAQPFAGEALPSTSIGSINNFCLIGQDPYLTFGGSLSDRLGYSHDVPPIPGAINSTGQAVIGFHRKDTNTSGQRIGFYVAQYGPQTGLGSFTRIDNGVGFTFGGALAIDSSGNIAAVWEERSLVSYTSGSQPENHIYLRLYTASTASWGTIRQMDDSTITKYGNTSFNHAPEAPMMPNVIFGDDNRVVVTWSGPACNTESSFSCRRKQFINQFYYRR